MSTFQSVRMASQAKEQEDKKLQERRKALVVLILRHLCDFGYIETAERLQAESQVSLDHFDAADNVDLLAILQEYEDFYEIRFQRRPKLIRKIAGEGRAGAEMSRLPNLTKGNSVRKKVSSSDNDQDSKPSGRPPRRPSAGASRLTPNGETKENGEDASALNITGSKTLGEEGKGAYQDKYRRNQKHGGDGEDPNDFWERRMLKPLPDFGGSSELRELGSQIQRDVLMSNPDVRWADIASNEDAKRLLKEAVVLPVKYPSLFQGLLSPWKGVLLYGPPGTGKTMLAKAVATECKTTFFNISASSIVSKWRGDSEKLVRVLFELARYHKPSTIFLDEIDSIMSQRLSSGQEHDGSRRMKTELLIQMDGVMSSSDLVFLLCASNLPWDLDSALLRRLEKRIFVPLPSEEARKNIIQKHLDETRANGLDYDLAAKRTEGFSGSDVVALCKEAAMKPLRRIMSVLESGQANGDKIKLGPVTSKDLEEALQVVRPAQRVNDQRYVDWSADYGSL
mmetsp:Transcript_16770/g.38249  ORF Transcript_16770/g.38249 Transcript_16770/m.38249 type:complete len:509 (-) Transcript_16770:5-1531(-)